MFAGSTLASSPMHTGISPTPGTTIGMSTPPMTKNWYDQEYGNNNNNNNANNHNNYNATATPTGMRTSTPNSATRMMYNSSSPNNPNNAPSGGGSAMDLAAANVNERGYYRPGLRTDTPDRNTSHHNHPNGGPPNRAASYGHFDPNSDRGLGGQPPRSIPSMDNSSASNSNPNMMMNMNQHNNKPQQRSSATGLIRLTLRKPMGIVFEPMMDPHNPSQQRGVRICDLPRTGAAAMSRKLEVGDELLSINDKTMSRLTFDEIMDFIIDADAENVNLLFRRPKKEGRGNDKTKDNSLLNNKESSIKWHEDVSPDKEHMSPGTDDNFDQRKKKSHHSSRHEEKDESVGSDDDTRTMNTKETFETEDKPRRRKRSSRGNKRYANETFLDMLIDSFCAPMMEESGRRGKRPDYSDDETAHSGDDSTYVTNDSPIKDRKQMAKYRNGISSRKEKEIAKQESPTKSPKKKSSSSSHSRKNNEIISPREGNSHQSGSSKLSKSPQSRPSRNSSNAQKIVVEDVNEEEEEDEEDQNTTPEQEEASDDESSKKTQETNDRTKSTMVSTKISRKSNSSSTKSSTRFDSEPTKPNSNSSSGKENSSSMMKKSSPSKQQRKASPPSFEEEPDPKAPIIEFEYDDRLDHGADVSVMESVGGPSLLIEQNRYTSVQPMNPPPPPVSMQLIRDFGRNYPPELGLTRQETIQLDPDKFYRFVVKDLLEKHEPEKVRLLDKLFTKYIGREEHLIQKLHARYTEQNTSQNVDKSDGNTSDNERETFPKHNQQEQPVDQPKPPTLVEKKDNDNQSQGSDYSDSDYESVDGASPAVIAQISELLNYVYGKTSVPGQIDRVSTIMKAYEGRESVLIELLETKALMKANAESSDQDAIPDFLKRNPAVLNGGQAGPDRNSHMNEPAGGSQSFVSQQDYSRSRSGSQSNYAKEFTKSMDYTEDGTRDTQTRDEYTQDEYTQDYTQDNEGEEYTQDQYTQEGYTQDGTQDNYTQEDYTQDNYTQDNYTEDYEYNHKENNAMKSQPNFDETKKKKKGFFGGLFSKKKNGKKDDGGAFPSSDNWDSKRKSSSRNSKKGGLLDRSADDDYSF
jgi:hypothetical protein